MKKIGIKICPKKELKINTDIIYLDNSNFWNTCHQKYNFTKTLINIAAVF